MKNKPVIVEQVFVELKLLLSSVDMILGGIRMLSFHFKILFLFLCVRRGWVCAFECSIQKADHLELELEVIVSLVM